MSTDVRSSPPSPQAQLGVTPNKLSLQGVIVSAAFMSFFVFLIIFICCCANRLSRRNQQVNNATTVASPASAATNVGLDPEVLRSLPVFMFSSKSNISGLKVECPVCLEEFKEGEKGRLLPSCHHRFHVECIDMWLHSHSTCPLCRSIVRYECPESDIV